MLIIELLFIQGLTFLALVFLLKKVLYSNFAKAMKRLQILAEENQQKRVELQTKLKALQESFNVKVHEAEAQAAKVRADAEQQAEEIRRVSENEARREADKLLEEARGKEDELRHQIETELGEKAARLAADALRYALAQRFDEAIHHQLIKDLVLELESVDPKRLDGHSQEAHVTIPFALKEDEKQKLIEAIEKKTKKKVSVVSEVDHSLIAGMILKFDTLILDGSLKTRLKEAVGYVRKGEKK